MNLSKFGITEEGDVYLLTRGFRRFGHIGHLVQARSPIAREVKRWWNGQLAADAPIAAVEVTELHGGRRRYRVVTSSASPASGPESAELADEAAA